MTERQLFLFLVEVTLLFLAARLGGEIAARLRIPLHEDGVLGIVPTGEDARGVQPRTGD